MRYADCTVSSFAFTSAPCRINRRARATSFAHAASRSRWFSAAISFPAGVFAESGDPLADSVGVLGLLLRPLSGEGSGDVVGPPPPHPSRTSARGRAARTTRFIGSGP